MTGAEAKAHAAKNKVRRNNGPMARNFMAYAFQDFELEKSEEDRNQK